jgi:AcrR family transcriptional regulator
MARPADPNARAALITAARAEFVKKGIRGARIEDITAACGLSKGAFYLHASSKEALFGELVAEFTQAMERLNDERLETVERFIAEYGPLEARDVAERTERYARSVLLHSEADLRTLELMWAWRDVLDVLIRGSAGTEFESLVWSIVDREVVRLSRDFERLLGSLAYRPDVPPEIIGSLLVGTYLLLAQKMCQMERKPDLAVWAISLHRLIREGSLSQGLPAKNSPRRSSQIRAPTRPRHTPRSGS